MPDEEKISFQCIQCGHPTGPPPEGCEEWYGLCPLCVVRQEVMPLIVDERVKATLDVALRIPMAIIEAIEEHGLVPVEAVAIKTDDPEAIIKAMSKILASTLMRSDGRAMMRGLISQAEGEPELQERPRTARVRNNPRWG